MNLNFMVDWIQNVDHSSTTTGGNRELFNRSFYSFTVIIRRFIINVKQLWATKGFV